ncbi:MAG: glycosyltransferase family 2 protein, partial [Ignisphaera sp.]
VNPFLLLAAGILLAASAIANRSLPATAALALGASMLSIKQYRTWVTQQLHLAAAALRNLWSREIAWSKQDK